MEANHPTVEFCFVFAFTFCKLRVYKTEEAFARRILEALDTAGEIELFERKDENCQEVDTRLLLVLVSKALPTLLEEVTRANILGVRT